MSRSSIDAVSSLTTLPLLSSEEDLVRILAGGGPQLNHLPAFLHEATHHWCSQRILGSALATLAGEVVLGAYDVAELAKQDLAAAQRRVARLSDALFRYEVGKELLRPLSEGMALFAEFDVVSGTRSLVVSRVYTWMQSVFLALSPDEGIGLRKDTLAFQRGDMSPEKYQWAVHIKSVNALLNCRIQTDCVHRKTRLLLNPFSPHLGGYLPGYLAVKNTWWQCSRRNMLLMEESDLFLTVLHAYIFDDPVLAHLLLDRKTPAIDACSAFATELSHRLQDLPEHVSMNTLDDFQKAQRQADSEAAQLSVIGRAGEGAGALQAVRRRTEEEFGTYQDTSDKVALAKGLFASREALYLGTLSCDVVIGDVEATAALAGHQIGFPVTTEAEHASTGDAIKLFAIVGDIGASVVAVVSYEGTAQAVHWVFAPSDVAALYGPRFLSGDMNYMGEQEVLGFARAALASFESTFVSQQMSELRDGLPEALRQIYEPIALNYEPPERSSELVASMKAFGIKGLCGDVNVVRTLSRLSLASATRPSRKSLTRVYDAVGEDLDEALRVAKANEGPVINLWTIRGDQDEYYVLSP